MKYRLASLSTIRFNFTNKVRANNNNYELKPQFGRAINQLNESNYELRLSFKLNTAEDADSPFDIDLEISGVFEFVDADKEVIDGFMKVNAVSIIFPYLRSILSSSLASLMIPPIVLPIVDAAEMFNNSENNQ